MQIKPHEHRNRFVYELIIGLGLYLGLLIAAFLVWRHHEIHILPAQHAKPYISYLDQNVNETQLRSWAAYYLTNQHSNSVTVDLKGSGLEEIGMSPGVVQQNGTSYLHVDFHPQVAFTSALPTHPPRPAALCSNGEMGYITFSWHVLSKFLSSCAFRETVQMVTGRTKYFGRTYIEHSQ